MRVNSTIRKVIVFVFLVCVVVIGAISFFVIKNQARTSAIENSKKTISEQIAAYSRNQLDLSKPYSIQKEKNFSTFSQLITGISNFDNIIIYDTNGTVIFSENPSNLNQNFLNDTKFKTAINGNVNIETVAKTNDVKMFVPLLTESGDIRAVISGQTNISSQLITYDNFIYVVIGISSILSGLIIIIAYLLFRNAEESVTQKDHIVLEKSKALEEERQQDEAIMASLAESLIVINKDGQIIYFNPEAERISGYKISDVEFRLYKNFIKFVDKEGQDQAKNPITESLKTGQKYVINIKDGYFIKRSGNELVPVSVTVAPILDKDKRTRGVAATINDLTAERELNKVRDEFVYVVAHELGNPIFALDGYLSILDGQLKKSDNKSHEILALAQGVNRQLSGLVNDLLEVVRNEQGTLTCEVSPISLSEIAEVVIKNAQFNAKAKKISLSYQPIKIPKAIGNEQKIKEVLTNFVDNAIKYTPGGGSVGVTHELNGKEIITHISDTGYGISKDAQEHLFEKFYRVKNSNTAGITGTGLGLFICKQIIEKCGGRTWAESEEGKGSTFSFSLKQAK